MQTLWSRWQSGMPLKPGDNAGRLPLCRRYSPDDRVASRSQDHLGRTLDFNDQESHEVLINNTFKTI